MKKTMELSQEALEAIKTQATARLEAHWNTHASEAEKQAAEERGATITGAYEFIKDYARRGAENGCACLPDSVVYELLCVFMHTAKDGDTYATADEIKAEEEREEQAKARAEADAKARAARKAEAVKAEQAKVEAMSEEERKAFEAERAEREAKEAQAKAEREAKEAERKAKAEAKARKKALADELAKRQLCFNF